jgi:hypothetical protein
MPQHGTHCRPRSTIAAFEESVRDLGRDRQPYSPSTSQNPSLPIGLKPQRAASLVSSRRHFQPHAIDDNRGLPARTWSWMRVHSRLRLNGSHAALCSPLQHHSLETKLRRVLREPAVHDVPLAGSTEGYGGDAPESRHNRGSKDATRRRPTQNDRILREKRLEYGQGSLPSVDILTLSALLSIIYSQPDRTNPPSESKVLLPLDFTLLLLAFLARGVRRYRMCLNPMLLSSSSAPEIPPIAEEVLIHE